MGNKPSGDDKGAVDEEEKKRIEEEKKEKEDEKKKEKEDEAEPVDEESKERSFRFGITSISVECETKMENLFVEFEFGGQCVDYEIEDTIEKVKIKKIKKPDGGVEEKEMTEVVNLKQIRVKRAPTTRYFSFMKKSIKAKMSEKLMYDSVGGTWAGSYADLKKEKLVIRVWSARLASMNQLYGEAKEDFYEVADSKVDRQVNIRKKGKGSRDEIVCVVKFKFELQEYFNFVLKFQSWEAEFKNKAHRMRRSCLPPGPTCQKLCCYSTKLTFRIGRSHANFLDIFYNACVPNPISKGLGTLALKDPELRSRPGSGSNAVAEVNYSGTRAWLEDEYLYIDWQKSVCNCCVTSIASTRVALQGTLDYGYIQSNVDVRRDACSLGCIGNYFGDKCMGFISGFQVCFGPTCNCGKAGYSLLGTALDKKEAEAQTVLADKTKKEFYCQMNLKGVIGCDDLPRYKQQGSVDPEKNEGLISLFKESEGCTMLVIKIIRAKGLMCINEIKEILNPTVTVEWEGIRKSTRTVPNSSNPFFDYDVFFKVPDQKSGPPRKWEDFPDNYRLSNVIFSIWDEDGLTKAPLGFCSIPFKTIYEKREEKTVQIFSSEHAKVKHLVYETKLPLETPYNQVADEKKTREAKKAADSDSRNIEFMAYFDRVDKVGIVISNTKDDKLFKEKKEETDTQKAYKRARVFWSESLRLVEGLERRYFAFFGKDEYSGDFHFLPCFMKPMHPPANMKDLSEIFAYVFAIECVQKPSVDADEVRIRKALESDDSTSPIKYSDVWVWSDPYFFFEKKKGDVKDHAMLLCNFLNGLDLHVSEFRAYVCIGTARSKDRIPKPHVWVMTQENFQYLDANGNKKKRVPVIRFWEITTGQTFELDGERFSTVYDHKKETEKEDVNKQRIMNDLPPLTALPVVYDEQEAARQKTKGDKEVAKEEKKEDEKVEKEEKKENKTADWDVVAKKLESEMAKVDTESDKNLLGLDTVSMEEIDSSNSVYASQSSAFVEIDRQGKRHRVQQLNEFVVEQEEKFQEKEKLEKDKRDDPEKEGPRFWDMNDKKYKTPYETIDVVFNHECLFGNLQNQNPEVIMYEFEKKGRWVEFDKQNWKECFLYKELNPFYIDRAIVSTLASDREAAELKKMMIQRLKSSVETERSYQYQLETVWFEKFDFANIVPRIETVEDYVRDRMALEIKHGMRDDLLRAVDFKRCLSNEKERKKELKTKLAAKKKDLLNKVLKNLKTGLFYEERAFHFKHADANRICEKVMKGCPELLKKDDKDKPKFAIGVNVERLPGQICPVRVIMILVYGKTDDDKDKDKKK